MKTSHRVPKVLLLPLQRKKQSECRLDTVSSIPLTDTNVKWWLYENKGEENLSASHLSHQTLHLSKQQLSKSSALACICPLKLPETNHSVQLWDTEDIFPLYQRPESWAGGQIPTSCLLFLRSTPRAGQRQNSRKTSCVPILPGHLHSILCTASSKAVHSAWASPHLRVQQLKQSPCLEKMKKHSHGCASSGLTELSIPWADRTTTPQRMSLQALENQYPNTSSSQSLTSTYPRAKV